MDKDTAAANGIPSDMIEALGKAGVRPSMHFHPPVHTVEEAQEHWVTIAGAHTKNLFLKDAGGQLWLVTALADRRVDLKKLPQTIGSKRLSFGSADLLRETLGVEPGSVSPLAVLRDQERKVNVAIDANLLSSEVVNMHPGVNTCTIGLTPPELSNFLAAHAHPPIVVDFG